MRYYVQDKLILLKKGETPPEGHVLVECLSSSEYKKRYEKTLHVDLLTRSLGNVEFCKADVLRSCIVGTFVIPCKEDLLEKESGFGYYMDKERLLFVDDNHIVEKMLEEICQIQVLPKTYVAHVFFEFLEYLTRDDVIFLQQYEEKLEEMEESLSNSDTREFNKKLLKCRRELLKLNAYYQQLMDLSDTLSENQNRLFNREDCRLFTFYTKRVERFYDTTHMLREYSMQLREMYQSQIDIHQNKVMQFLTVVTTIFMPLTLIAGWYGMNFANMPELKTKYGYGIIILVSILVTGIEIWYFKIKKWFK